LDQVEVLETVVDVVGQRDRPNSGSSVLPSALCTNLLLNRRAAMTTLQAKMAKLMHITILL
jgi:hypothetical protein